MSNESQSPENEPLDLDGPAEPTPVVFIIGAGVVGTTLAAKLTRAGVPVAGLHGRQADLSDAGSALAGVLGSTGALPDILSQSQVVIISVRDARIPEVAKRLADEKRLRPDQVVLHTSGNHPAAEMLASVKKLVKGVGTLHPLIAVTDAPGTLENLASRGDRMVGVITHVPGLAERVPVRFAVRRDQRSARIEREGI